MENVIDDLINWIKAKDEKLVIGVSGHGAAGKTSFTETLLKKLASTKVNYINTDSYIVSSGIRRRTLIDYRYNNEDHRFKMTACHPAAHHLSALERDIQMVRKGLDFYTIDTHYLPSQRISSSNKLTIVEGMSAAFIDPELFDLKIYFYTDGDTELARRSSRDLVERGTNLNYLKASHTERRIQYELFMHPYSENCDIVIRSVGDQQIVEKLAFDFTL